MAPDECTPVALVWIFRQEDSIHRTPLVWGVSRMYQSFRLKIGKRVEIDFFQESISSTFYSRLFCQYFGAKNLQSQTNLEKSCSIQFCTKNVCVQRWWNWQQVVFFEAAKIWFTQKSNCQIKLSLSTTLTHKVYSNVWFFNFHLDHISHVVCIKNEMHLNIFDNINKMQAQTTKTLALPSN